MTLTQRPIPARDVKFSAFPKWTIKTGELLDRYLRGLEKVALGIPHGFLNILPSRIQAGVAAFAGAVSAGWAAANHVHDIETAAPSQATGQVALEGSGTALMRAGATVKQGIVTTKGDLLGFGTLPDRLLVGTEGQVLIVAAAAALGLKYVDQSTLSGVEDDRWAKHLFMGGF